MKTKTFFITLLVALFLANLTSAGSIIYLSDNEEDRLYKEKISTSHYNPYWNSVTTKTVTAYYDNEDRHSTYNYRHGYSYRTTKQYWKKHHDYYDHEDYNHKHYKKRYYNDRYDKYDEYAKKRRYYKHPSENKHYHKQHKRTHYDHNYKHYKNKHDYKDYNHKHHKKHHYYYEDKPIKKKRYVPYMKHYEEVECYNYPPQNKLFYIEC